MITKTYIYEIIFFNKSKFYFYGCLYHFDLETMVVKCSLGVRLYWNWLILDTWVITKKKEREGGQIKVHGNKFYYICVQTWFAICIEVSVLISASIISHSGVMFWGSTRCMKNDPLTWKVTPIHAKPSPLKMKNDPV